jgi:hypothetical protein
MRKLNCLLVGALIASSACSDSYNPTPSASGVFPSEAFIGRQVRVEISGEETKWADGATVSFGDGITVSNVVVASESDIFADLDIAATAPLADHDVTVTNGKEIDTLKTAFRVTSPVDFQVGQAAQGSITQFTVTNHDFDNPFDTTSVQPDPFSPPVFTNVQITGGTGVTFQVSNVTAFSITGVALFDVDAPASIAAPQIASGPAGGTQVTSNAAPIAITARTATVIADGTAATGMATVPYDSGLYSFTPGGSPSLLDLSISSTSSSGATQFALLPSSGHFADLLAANQTDLGWVLKTGSVYVVAYDLSGDTGFSYQLNGKGTTLSHAATDDEATNNDPTTATALTSPALIDNASLTDGSDVDWFQITVPAGKKIHVVTSPGDLFTDTLVDIYGPNDSTTLVTESDDLGFHENVTTDTLTAGTYYVAISASPYFDSSQSHYVAAVVLE